MEIPSREAEIFRKLHEKAKQRIREHFDTGLPLLPPLEPGRHQQCRSVMAVGEWAREYLGAPEEEATAQTFVDPALADIALGYLAGSDPGKDEGTRIHYHYTILGRPCVADEGGADGRPD